MVTHGYLFATIGAMQPMEESFQIYVNNLAYFLLQQRCQWYFDLITMVYTWNTVGMEYTYTS